MCIRDSPYIMRSRFYAVLSILLFGILYCYTAVGVVIVLILSFLHLKKPVSFLFQMWAKSVFLIMGKKFRDYVPFKEPNYRNTKQMINQLIYKSKYQSVAIFPEGTRTLSGKINQFYRGFIYLFRTRDIEILPVTCLLYTSPS